MKIFSQGTPSQGFVSHDGRYVERSLLGPRDAARLANRYLSSRPLHPRHIRSLLRRFKAYSEADYFDREAMLFEASSKVQEALEERLEHPSERSAPPASTAGLPGPLARFYAALLPDESPLNNRLWARLAATAQRAFSPVCGLVALSDVLLALGHLFVSPAGAGEWAIGAISTLALAPFYILRRAMRPHLQELADHLHVALLSAIELAGSAPRPPSDAQE